MAPRDERRRSALVSRAYHLRSCSYDTPEWHLAWQHFVAAVDDLQASEMRLAKRLDRLSRRSGS